MAEVREGHPGGGPLLLIPEAREELVEAWLEA
jgi:hypothetical protein